MTTVKTLTQMTSLWNPADQSRWQMSTGVSFPLHIRHQTEREQRKATSFVEKENGAAIESMQINGFTVTFFFYSFNTIKCRTYCTCIRSEDIFFRRGRIFEKGEGVGGGYYWRECCVSKWFALDNVEE